MPAAGLGLSAAGLVLVVVCWRSRTILGLLCGTLGIALALASLFGPTESVKEAPVAALLAIVIGTVLFVLGQVVQRLLEAEPDDGA